MKFEHVVHHSGRNAPPLGAAVWSLMTGFLTGDGTRRFAWHTTHVGPHIIVRGQAVVRTSAGECVLGVGDMFCLMPGTQVEYAEVPDAPWQYYWLHLVGTGALDWALACGFDPRRPWLRPSDPAAALACFRRVHGMLAEPRTLRPHRIVAELHALADACSGGNRDAVDTGDKGQDLIARAETVVESLLHTGLNVVELAAALAVDRSTLFLAFRKRLGTTPTEYIQAARIRRAQELLRESDRRLTAVARMCGFASEKYFLHCFRQRTGQTPTRWRREPDPA
ncbi:MAG: AraC family transcriptional regulator [Lentisphaerae bacterium]|jgi:AraC-like DNA-binding protein|nr:AraC family transcriptional regulator [Lentisphaerota bacterium]MBT4814798.1 AraC family transcriptional regulator [Lentisphaerota bacterium]MBT5611010.1 AraC family transcriptional regulator [Lentisphaerota bacterium]MBT7061201.1 AraC family transcriptional regulator [Lentisphaerota bacterium]